MCNLLLPTVHKISCGKIDDLLFIELEVFPDGDGSAQMKGVLQHSHKAIRWSEKISITKMLIGSLANPTKGKLCIIARHLDVLDKIVVSAGLSNKSTSTTKYIRIDSLTSLSDRRWYMEKFQKDPTVRIALLGVTAANLATELVASTTIWFAEWMPLGR